jgi:hypothetical protein
MSPIITRIAAEGVIGAMGAVLLRTAQACSRSRSRCSGRTGAAGAQFPRYDRERVGANGHVKWSLLLPSLAHFAVAARLLKSTSDAAAR